MSKGQMSASNQEPDPLPDLNDLVHAHYAELYRYAYRLSGTQSDAEDLTQQAFLTAHEKLDQLRESSQARAWLYAILRNAFLRTRRRATLEGQVSLEETGEAWSEAIETPELTEEELSLALADLAEEFRVPLMLYYFESLCYRDIAEALEIPIGTVMSRLARGKSYLRQRFTDPQPVGTTRASESQ